MHRTSRCFLCAWELGNTKAVPAEYRTAVPEWESIALCGTCATKVKERGEALIFKHSEWLTIRVKSETKARAVGSGWVPQ